MFEKYFLKIWIGFVVFTAIMALFNFWQKEYLSAVIYLSHSVLFLAILCEKRGHKKIFNFLAPIGAVFFIIGYIGYFLARIFG